MNRQMAAASSLLVAIMVAAVALWSITSDTTVPVTTETTVGSTAGSPEEPPTESPTQTLSPGTPASGAAPATSSSPTAVPTSPPTSAPIAPDPLSASPPFALAVYDTAWDIPFFATMAEIDVYLDHLAATGYSGAWMSLIGFSGRRNGQLTPSPDLGVPQATIGDDGSLLATQENLSKMSAILDAAGQRGLRIGIVATWGQHWLNGDGDNCFANSSQIGNGPLQASNAEALGRQIGEHFAGHPAIAFWVLGGDNYCQQSVGDASEDPAIWRNYAVGLRAGGANHAMTYHSPHSPGAGLRPAHTWMMNEDWVDFLSPQTGHCVSDSMAQEQLAALIAVTDKPVVASEPRYETVPGVANFCGATVGPAEIGADARAAISSGAAAILFGHHARFSWGADDGSGTVRPASSEIALGTLGSPGERALFENLSANN